MDPNQDRHSVGPDLGPNCLKSLSADNIVFASKERVKIFFLSLRHLSIFFLNCQISVIISVCTLLGKLTLIVDEGHLSRLRDQADKNGHLSIQKVDI